VARKELKGESDSEDEFMNKEKINEQQSSVPTLDGSNLEEIQNNLPSAKRSTDGDRNIDFRLKALH